MIVIDSFAYDFTRDGENRKGVSYTCSIDGGKERSIRAEDVEELKKLYPKDVVIFNETRFRNFDTGITKYTYKLAK